MNRKKIFAFIAVSMFALPSCDDFINKNPVDQIAVNRYFADEVTAESAVLGIYRLLESSNYYGQAMVVVPEFSAQHLKHVGDYPEYVTFAEHQVRTDNPWVLNIWTLSYYIINAANHVIDAVPAMTNISTPGLQDQLVNEAKFIRALVYFNLVRSWGDVPLVTSPTKDGEGLNVFKTPSAEIYEQIVSDLTDALALPENYGATVAKTKGRATLYAAEALLAKVYLYIGQYENAASLAKAVIDNGGLTLTADYPSIWLTENSSEAIFELQFDVAATNPLATVSNPTASVLFLASDTVFNLFEDGDLRRDFTINIVGSRSYMGKYRNYNPATQNVPLIRLSEVYLIYAEAQARVTSHTGDPYFYYKEIRTRAGLATPDEASFDTDSFITAVQKEKRLELMFEGEAWYDYVRTGLALTEMMADNPNADYFLYPVPQLELALNKNLDQNDGY